MGQPLLEDQRRTHPEGGWGWCVVAAAFITQFIVVGLQNSFGVIFDKLVDEYDESKGKIAWIGSIAVGIMFILGPISTSLCDNYGCRMIGFIGGLICSVSLVASAFTSSIAVMFFTYGVCWGVGSSFCYFPTLITLVPWFDKRLPLVNGVVSSGSGLGTLVLGPVLQWLIERITLRSTLFLLAGLHGFVSLCALAYRRLSFQYRHLQDEQHSLLLRKISSGSSCSKPLLYQRAYLVLCVALSSFMLGYFVPFVHLVRYARVAGIDEHKASFLIGILAIVATACKVVVGKIAGLTCVNQLVLYQLGLLIMGIANTLLPVSSSYASLVAYAVAVGISESCFIVMIPILTKTIVGARRLPRALGYLFAVMGIPTMIGPPIAGWIYDIFQAYEYAFYMAGGMNTLGVLIMFLMFTFNENHGLEKYNDFLQIESLSSSRYTCLVADVGSSSLANLNEEDRRRTREVETQLQPSTCKSDSHHSSRIRYINGPTNSHKESSNKPHKQRGDNRNSETETFIITDRLSVV